MAGRKEKKQDAGAGGDPNAWMVTFGDLIMLLLTFFVMLLTMKSMDGGALQDRFAELSESIGPLDFNDVISGGSLIEGTHARKQSIMVSEVKTIEDVRNLLSGIERKKSEEYPLTRFDEIVEIKADERGVIVIMEFDYLFDSGTAEIRSDGFGVLDRLEPLFRSVENDVLIMGHSDNTPVGGGGFQSNLELSVYRALGVLFYLTDGLGLKPDRFAAGGFGDLRPRYPNDSETGRSKNRRIEFILKNRAA